jgi:myo-inositol 2-dehydrogenase/D-chiro-inositol 1-dehydrogenase
MLVQRNHETDMTIRIGIIGTGVMGADHANTLARNVPGAVLECLYDADQARARSVADATGAKNVATSPTDLIKNSSIDAILIASPDQTHKDLVLECLAVKKPLLCEKPLAPSAAECLEVIGAETKLGRRLVQVGYMRRFDPPYVEMREALRSRQLGKALMLHCVHRNVSAPSWFDEKMAVTNSAVHEFDIARFLLDDDLARVDAHVPAAASGTSVGAPVFLVLHSVRGITVTIEVFNNAGYGYEVNGELVCEKGSLSLRQPAHLETRAALAQTITYPADWRPRFETAYRLQLRAWVESIKTQKPEGASAWDGYAASAIAEAGLRSLAQKGGAAIAMERKPGLYS